jgi:hypothetical protein
MYNYRAYDLFLSSELPIPELEVSEGTPDVTIRVGNVPPQLRGHADIRRFFQAAPNEFLLKLEKIAGYYVKNGREITIEPYMDINAPDIRLFLLGSAFGALLHQRGYLVLHGASAVINGKGVLITGKSGIGKSTLAAVLHKKGYPILADDVCAVKIDGDGTPYISPGFPSLKLWQDAAKKLDTSIDGLEPVKSDMEKYRVGIETGYGAGAVRLDEIYELRAYNGENIEITPTKNLVKLETLIRNTYRYRFLYGQGIKAEHFKQCAAVAGKVEIFSVLRPDTGFRIDELVAAIKYNIDKE